MSDNSSVLVPKLLHEIFIDYLKDEQLEAAMEIIGEEDFDVHFIFDVHNYEFNAFQVVCFEIYLKLEAKQAPIPQYVKCAKLLLDSGVEIQYCDPDYKFEAIQFAVMTGQIDLVEHTIERYEQDEVSVVNYHLMTQLISLSIDEGGISPEYLQLLEYLVNKNVNVNKLDLDTGEPPIYMAAKMKYKSIVKLLIDMKPYVIDLDFYVDENGKTARNLIEKYHLYDGILPSLYSLTNYHLFQTMFDIIEFIKEYKKVRMETSIDQKIYLLCRSLDFGLHEVFEHIFGDVPKEMLHHSLLLRTVCRRGYYKILKTVLKYPRIGYDEALVEELVSLKRIENDPKNHRSSNKCLELLLERTTLNLNLLDKNKNSLLEIALKYGHTDMVLTLLNNGASFIKYINEGYECLIAFAPPDLIKTYLDSCVSRISKAFKYGKLHVPESVDTTVSSIDYTIDFTSFLVPRRVQITPNHKIAKFASQYVQELIAFDVISRNPKYVQLLTHPFATVFLYMKWHKVRWVFYADSILYVLYALLANLIIYFTRNLVCLCLLIVIIVLAETWQSLQIFIHGWNQLYVFENWYKFLLFVLSVAFVVDMFFFATSEISRQLEACLSLVSITNIFFASGFIPYFSTSVIMIKSIYNTIFKSFIHYTFLLIAFAMTFHVLFKSSYGKFFENYAIAVFKTVLMASGEYDTINLGLHAFPDVGNFILLFFVVLISLGLLNFLTGLSVSDINKVKKNAEVFGQIMRIERMARIEKLIFNANTSSNFLILARYICLFPLTTNDTVVEIDTKHRHVHYFRPKHVVISIQKNIVKMLKIYSHKM